MKGAGQPLLRDGGITRLGNQRRRVMLVVVVLLLLGAYFRVANLDRKVYWSDETSTSLRLAGYTGAEVDEELIGSGRLVSVEELDEFLYPGPPKSVADTVRGLASEESQLTPAYFILARQWVQWFGDSVAVTRGFSVFLGLLAFPCVYWLCRELFESQLVAWVAVALTAISPVHIVYAQEARPYSLWIVATLVSSMTLLRALRTQTRRAWGIYAAIASLGLYTHLLFSLVGAAHAVYVAALGRFRLTRPLRSFLISGTIAVISFVPWILVVFLSPDLDTVGWAGSPQTLVEAAARWAGIVSRGFVDLGVGPADPLRAQLAVSPLIVLTWALACYSIWVVVRETPIRVWLFIVTLASFALPFMLFDLVTGGRSGTTRFILPSLLALQLAVAYLLTTRVAVAAPRALSTTLWRTAATALLVASLASAALYSQAEIWWNKLPDVWGDYPDIARSINSEQEPIVIAYSSRKALVLSPMLDTNVRLFFPAASGVPELKFGSAGLFVLDPPDSTIADLAQALGMDLEHEVGELWKLEP